MKKFALILLAVVGMAVLAGCRAEGEIDTRGNASVPAAR
jgi:hypothetical protein